MIWTIVGNTLLQLEYSSVYLDYYWAIIGIQLRYIYLIDKKVYIWSDMYVICKPNMGDTTSYSKVGMLNHFHEKNDDKSR